MWRSSFTWFEKVAKHCPLVWQCGIILDRSRIGVRLDPRPKELEERWKLLKLLLLKLCNMVSLDGTCNFVFILQRAAVYGLTKSLLNLEHLPWSYRSQSYPAKLINQPRRKLKTRFFVTSICCWHVWNISPVGTRTEPNSAPFGYWQLLREQCSYWLILKMKHPHVETPY